MRRVPRAVQGVNFYGAPYPTQDKVPPTDSPEVRSTSFSL